MKKIVVLLFIILIFSISLTSCNSTNNKNEGGSFGSGGELGDGGFAGGSTGGNTGNMGTNNGNGDNSGNGDNAGEDINHPCTEHTFEEKEKVSPTNNMPGYSYNVCKNCGYDKTDIVSPTAQTASFPSLSINDFAVESMKKAISDSEALFTSIKKNGETDIFNFPLSGVSDYLIIREFTLNLISDCKTETEKAAKIHKWITDNIEYDTNYMFATVFQSFTDKKAVCFGYTALMHDMLAAAGIMSVYASGVVDETASLSNHYTYNHVFDQMTIPMAGTHAWIILYADGKSLVCDPTWNTYFTDFNNGFNIPVETIAKTHLVLNLNALTVIPDSADARLYSDAVTRIGNRLFALHNGELVGGGNTIHNSIEFNLVDKDDDLLSENSIPGEIVSNGFFGMSKQDFVKDQVAYWKYAMPDGRTYEYSIILTYALSMKHFCNIEISIDNSAGFILKDGLIYLKESEGYTVFGYVGTDKNIIIPGEINGTRVFKIGTNAFRDNNVIESVTIKEGVEIIDELAFDEAENLRSVTLPSTLRTIKSNAFSYTQLTEVVIPEGVTVIETGAFLCNYFLRKITLPTSIKELKVIPFYYCAIEEITFGGNDHFKLVDGVLFTKDGKTLMLYPAGSSPESYAIPQGTEVINYGAFQKAENLKSITFPTSLKIIMESGFEACISLDGVVIPNSVTEIGPNAFNHCTSLKNITISNSLEILGDIFQSCSALESVYIPASVNYIGGTFMETLSLKSIIVDPNNQHFKSVSGVLYTKDGKTLIHYPAAREGDSYTVLSGTERIHHYAFFGTKLKSLILPEGLTYINPSSFIANNELSTLVLPSTLSDMLDLPVLAPNHKVFCSFAKNAVPEAVNIPYTANVYWLGEWEMINGVPTPKS